MVFNYHSLGITQPTLQLKDILPNKYFLYFQDSQRAVMDIGESVKVVDLLARQSYREHQLEPFLSKLKEEADNTVTLIGDLNESLKCESLFRSVIILLFAI